MPKISVIIPTHNRPEMLIEAIASIKSQTFVDYEIIVVSNGESYRVKRLTQTIARNEGCRYFYLNEGNRSAARNIAIKEAKSELIAFLDDDDLWNPEKLQQQLEKMYETGADCIFTDFILRDMNSNIDRIHHIVPVNNAVCCGLTIPESFMVWRAGTGGCSTVLIKRQVLLDLGGFDESMTLVEDWDMWRRVSHKHKIVYLEETLSILRTHSANGENHATLRPWRCTYWEIYHINKAIRYCPPELRHMIPRMLSYICKRTLLWHPIFVLTGLRIGDRQPFKWIFDWGRPIYRRVAGREIHAFREWLRPRRRINAAFKRNIFRPPH
jgi:glycosyltransferase involved in cell wall biosynthesis